MGYINGYAYYNDGDLDITIAAVTADRIDRAALRLDFTARSISIVIKTGTVGASPVAPELIRTTDIWEMGLADINLSAGIDEITADRITDLRANPDLCGEIFFLIYNSKMAANVTNAVAEFTHAGARINIDAADTLAVMFGKIKKWFADLGTAAFANTGTAAGNVPLIGADGKLSASIIGNSVIMPSPSYFGNGVTDLQGVVNTVNAFFGGTFKPSKIIAGEFNNQ
jgi:hypothetical protein